MGRISLNISDVFLQAFGYTLPDFEIEDLPTRKEFANLGSPYYKKDAIGREYYMPVTLGGIYLHHPVIRVSGSKNVVETEMQGRDGTVKEYINANDYLITIRGLIVSEVNEYPEEAIEELRELCERKEALEIGSPITDIFLVTPDRAGFDKVVIMSYDFPEVSGIGNVRPYELRLKSDSPFDLYID